LLKVELQNPKWSKHIFSEWENAMRRKHVPIEEIKKRISNAQRAFPDALIENYETLVDAHTFFKHHRQFYIPPKLSFFMIFGEV